MANKQVSESSPAELRKHYFLDSYVIIAPGRNRRPDLFSRAVEPHKTPSKNCPFDHNSEPSIWISPKTGAWDVKVVRNIFPALSPDNPRAFGIQEIIIDTPDHDSEFSDLPISHIEDIFSAFRNRLTELSKLDGIRYVLIFKNDGPIAGASVPHAHCQIFALPIVPPKIAHESDALNEYWNSHNTCGYCDIIVWEARQKVRIITQDKSFVAIAPYASSHALEAWIIPKRHISKFAELHATELHSLAVIMKRITARLDASSFSFNFILQESLSNQSHHFLIKIEPRTTKFAGAELGTGVEINPISPEFTALWYRGELSAESATAH
jgi:UDPglucose--hexose-1-phosphate uridylyltransferase